jgi:hypothetical protein
VLLGEVVEEVGLETSIMFSGLGGVPRVTTLVCSESLELNMFVTEVEALKGLIFFAKATSEDRRRSSTEGGSR